MKTPPRKLSRRRRAALIASLALVAPSWAMAQPATGVIEDKAAPPKTDPSEVPKVENIEELDLEAMLGTVSSVSRKTESVLRAPAAVTTFSAEEIRKSGATMVPDLLRLVPGVQLFRTAPGNFTVSIRGTGGLASNNVVVLIDGMPINSPIDGSIDWSLIPVDVRDVRSVEVVRGPVSTIYGANAYTGVISISTVAADGRFAGNALRATGGADNHLSPEGNVSGRVGGNGDKLSWQVLADARADKLYSQSTTVTQPALKKAGLLARASLTQSEDSKLQLEAFGNLAERSAVDHIVLDANPRRTGTGALGIKYERAHLAAFADQLTLWGRGYAVAELKNDAVYRGFSYGGATGVKGEAGADLALALPDPFTATIGANAMITRVDAPFIHPLENRKARPGYGFYANLGVNPTEALSITAAARGDISDMTANLEFSYRGAVIYTLPSASVRLSAASAYRSPTWVEVGGRFVDPGSQLILLEGAPDLKSPRIDSLELGAILEPRNRFTLSPTLYASRFTNAVVEDFKPLVRKTFRNDPATHGVLGAELEGRLLVSSDLSFFASLGLLHYLEPVATDATVAVPAQNSTVTAALRVQGSAVEERFGYGAAASVGSPRSYALRAGIPPQVLISQTPTLVELEGNASWRLFPKSPLSVFLRAQAFVPPATRDAPYASAGQLGESAIIGLEYDEGSVTP